VMGRLYAAARLYVNFFQPSFKLKEKRREGAKVIKRYHPPSTPYERTLAHPKVYLPGRSTTPTSATYSGASGLVGMPFATRGRVVTDPELPGGCRVPHSRVKSA
jgi:hypothetical protein